MSSLKYIRIRTNLTHTHSQTQEKLQEIGRIIQPKLQERSLRNQLIQKNQTSGQDLCPWDRYVKRRFPREEHWHWGGSKQAKP